MEPELPNELLAAVFAYLSAVDLYSAARTCKRWDKIATCMKVDALVFNYRNAVSIEDFTHIACLWKSAKSLTLDWQAVHYPTTMLRSSLLSNVSFTRLSTLYLRWDWWQNRPDSYHPGYQHDYSNKALGAVLKANSATLKSVTLIHLPERGGFIPSGRLGKLLPNIEHLHIERRPEQRSWAAKDLILLADYCPCLKHARLPCSTPIPRHALLPLANIRPKRIELHCTNIWSFELMALKSSCIGLACFQVYGE